jgi:hypothetical protein
MPPSLTATFMFLLIYPFYEISLSEEKEEAMPAGK